MIEKSYMHQICDSHKKMNKNFGQNVKYLSIYHIFVVVSGTWPIIDTIYMHRFWEYGKLLIFCQK